MRICLNGRFLTQNITGVQRVAREVLTELDEMAATGAIEVPRLLLPDIEVLNAPNLKSIRPEIVGSRDGHIWEQLELPRHVQNDVLLCLGNSAPILSLLGQETKVVTMIHDLSYRYFPEAYSWKFRALYSALIPLVLRKSDRVVTVSMAERNAIIEHYPFLRGDSKLSYAQNGGISDSISASAFKEPSPGYLERDYGLYVGSLSKRKNADGVIRSAIKFLSQNPNRRFVIIGASSSVFEAIDVQVPEQIAQRIEMRGQVNEVEEIHRAYKSAIFLAFPSFYEASPLPPIEAMTFGCPVISSDIPSLEERCGDAALYCDKSSVESISEAMNQISMNREAWEKLSQASREHAAKFSWRKQAEHLVSLCTEVTAS